MSDFSDPDEKPARVTPANLPGLLPSRPVLSSPTEGWRHLVLQRYQHPPGTITVPGPRDHVLVAHLVGPVLIQEDSPRGSHERRWSGDGQISLTPAGRPVSRTLMGRPDVLLIHIAPELVCQVAKEAYDLDPASVALVPRLAVPDEALNRLGRLLLAEVEAGAPGTGLMADLLGRALALNLLRCHSNLAPLPPEKPSSLVGGRLRRVIEHMRTHVDEALPLAQLAGMGGLSPSQFARVFREATGQPPHRYLVGLRIDKARDLLEHTHLSVTEVGLLCGFDQPAHFATMFQKMTGMSPRAWRIARRL